MERELADLRAQDADHLTLDDAACMFNDDAFFASSKDAYNHMIDNGNLKNKLRAEIEKLKNKK